MITDETVSFNVEKEKNARTKEILKQVYKALEEKGFYVDDDGKGHLTKGIQPHPYMRPALNEQKNKIKDILKEGLLNDWLSF